MSVDLQRELHDLAGQAKQYANSETVLRVVRRRRRRRGLLASAAAAVAVIAVAGTVALYRPPAAAPLPGTAAGPAPSTVELPAVVNPPAGTVPDLPTDHGIGPVALAYQPTLGGPEYLVRPDGTQYRVRPPGLSGPNVIPQYRQFALSLSPDGRWLVLVGDNATLVRDLTGTTVRTLAGTALPESWSPDGRWLVYAGPSGTGLLNTTSGRTYAPAGAADDLDTVPTVDGHTLSTPVAANTGRTLNLQSRDPVHGGPTEPVLVDAGGLLTADESLVWHFDVGPAGAEQCSGTTTWMSQISGDRVLLGVFRTPHASSCAAAPKPTDPVAYVLAEAGTGRVLGRVSLPAGAGKPLWLGDELMFPVQSSPTDRVRIEAMNAMSGQTRTLTSLPAGGLFVLDGAASPVIGPALG